MPAAALLLPLLVVLPYAVLGAPTDPPLSGLIVRDYPSGLARRDIIQSFSDFVSNLADGVSKSDIIQGILPDFFQNIPSASKIKSQLGLNDTGIAALPLEVLNIPGYANYTSQGWNLLVHGQAYKQPLSNPNIVSNKTLDKAANVFLPDFDISQLQPHEQDNARNLTSAILSLSQEDVQLVFSLDVADGQDVAGGWSGEITWPKLTDSRGKFCSGGEFNGFVQLPASSTDLPDGNATMKITKLNIHTNGTDTGNATGYLVPNQGVTIISDIDDILRITKIYQPKEGILNTFARDMVPWLNMPDIYANWSRQNPSNPYHFHYLTTTPEQATRVYMQFIYHTYPAGSFDTRPLNFTTIDQTFTVRRTLLLRALQSFPHRKFVLVGDTSNDDVMNDYPELATLFPDQVACILLRNTTAEDPTDRFPYNTARFRALEQERYMFFTTPDDLRGLDFANGDCRNASAVMGTVVFGWQGLPLGLGKKSVAVRVGGSGMWAAVAAAAAVVAAMMVV